jgi:putative DNA primase/helicase
MASARKMVEAHLMTPDGLRVIHYYRGNFYWYANGFYRPAEEGEARRAVWDFLDAASKLDNGRPEPFQPNMTSVSNVTDALAAVCQVGGLELPAWLPNTQAYGADLPPHEFLVVANGLLHVPSGELYPHTPAFFSLNAAEMEFDPSAMAPTWLSFLDEVFDDDHESRSTIQEWFGYCLTPDTSLQKAMFLVGPPRGGKGIISRTLRSLIGPRNVTSPTLHSLQGEFGMQSLIGKQLATINDVRLGRRADPSTVAERLLAITGEDPVSVNRKNQSFWEGRLKTRFMLLSNELPHFTDSSVALINRFIVVQFTRSWLGKEDITLENRIQQELSGILNWALEGYRRLHARGYFVQSKSALDAIQAMEDLASPIRAFVRDCCIVEPDQEVLSRSLFDRWEFWCETQGQNHPGTVQQFGKQLRAAYSGIRMKQHPRRYVGIGLDRVRMQETAAHEHEERKSSMGKSLW